jgi:hypothetical protein
MFLSVALSRSDKDLTGPSLKNGGEWNKWCDNNPTCCRSVLYFGCFWILNRGVGSDSDTKEKESWLSCLG